MPRFNDGICTAAHEQADRLSCDYIYCIFGALLQRASNPQKPEPLPFLAAAGAALFLAPRNADDSDPRRNSPRSEPARTVPTGTCYGAAIFTGVIACHSTSSAIHENDGLL